MRDSITVRILDAPIPVVAFPQGRDAWALRELLKAGPAGITPLERPAPRWSAYVHNLRRMGFEIATLHERHGGAYSGTHGRYVLRSSVAVLADAANG